MTFSDDFSVTSGDLSSKNARGNEVTMMYFMLKTNMLVFCLMLSMVLTGQARSQTPQDSNKTPQLASPTSSVTCETQLEYIDNALAKASESDSNLILIVKSRKGTTFSMNKSRSNGLSRYMEHRGFKFFAVGVDLVSDVSDRVDLFVKGQLLYSLPITRKDNLDFTPCVIGNVP